jgi:hypothetical protein
MQHYRAVMFREGFHAISALTATLPSVRFGTRWVARDFRLRGIHLFPSTKRFIEVLTDDVKKWEKAAIDVDAMLQHLQETDRKHWKEMAKEYRARANRYMSMIEHAKEDDLSWRQENGLVRTRL